MSSTASLTLTNSNRPLRPTIELKRHHQVNRNLLSLKKTDLASQIAHRGDHLKELRSAARSSNGIIRSHYADFIHDVGRNLYPLILFTDYEVDGPCGVGSTLTLYRADGSQTKVSPALQTNYELYKTCGHLLMGLGVELGPYLSNSTLCYAGCDDDMEDGKDEGSDLELISGLNQVIGRVKVAPWESSLNEYLKGVKMYHQALVSAVEVEAVAEDMAQFNLVSDEDEKKEDKHQSPHGLGLPTLEMQETMIAMMTSVIEFCEACLDNSLIDMAQWERLNRENFPRIKKCMQAAVKDQADACVRQLIEWREMMGPQEWRELYVIIPTVWAVDAENPRKTMMRQLMDEDRVDSHILLSEYPRNHGEARTLLGRVAGDRAIGRFVFGDDTKEQKIKTMGLSSEVDVVQDDALPAIWDALERNGCPVRQNRSSASCQHRLTVLSQDGSQRSSRSDRPSFCSHA